MKKSYIIGGSSALVMLIVSIILSKTQFFLFFVGIALIVGMAPIVFSVMRESKIASEKEEMFLEFSRNLVESVKTGTPISKSIINMRNKDYGVLSENVQKLANQISMGIPLNTALNVFSDDIGNRTISRAIVLIGQAEKAGGQIGEILEAVAEAVNLSDRLKKERKASIQTLVVQGYIIFIVFIVIILVMQFKIIPMVSGIAQAGSLGIGGIGSSGGTIDPQEISNAFLYLLLIQGFFSGITIGKLAEGNIKFGIKHSFALMILSFVIATGANIIFA